MSIRFPGLAATATATFRLLAGLYMIVGPNSAWTQFARCPVPEGGGASLIMRLLGARDITLAANVFHPNAAAARAALQAGVATDVIDSVSAVLAARAGGDKSSLPVSLGAAGLSIVLGLVGLRRPPR